MNMAHTLKVYCDRFLSLIETFIRLKVIHRSSYKIDIYSINWSNSRWSMGKKLVAISNFFTSHPTSILVYSMAKASEFGDFFLL